VEETTDRPPPTTGRHDFVTTASYSSTAEYDAFGPWIDEVTTPAEVPRLYSGHAIDFGGTIRILKFPRNIARREANPSMHLYDHLAIVTRERLTILSRDGDTYTELGLAHDQIAAITDWVNLLDAQLTFFTTSGDVLAVPYNGSSNDTVVALVDLVRELGRETRLRRPVALPAGLPPLGLDDLGKKDAVFVTSYRDLLRREPDTRMLAAHGRSTVGRRGGLLARLADAVLPATLHGAVIAAGGTELQVLSRREWFTRGGAPVLSRARTVVPLDSIVAVTTAEHPRYLGVSVVTVQVGSARIPFDVPEDSAARGVLLALRR
jgi:hypothetical protein